MSKPRVRSVWRGLLLAAVLLVVPVNGATLFTFTATDIAGDECLSCIGEQALEYLQSEASLTFLTDNYVSLDTLISGATITVVTTPLAGAYGEYRGGGGDAAELNKIYLDSTYLEIACDDCSDRANQYRRFMALTLAHEFIHWADMHDGSTTLNDNGKSHFDEEGSAWETAVFGQVMYPEDVSDAIMDPCPEPASGAGVAAVLLLVGLARWRRARRA